ncbi:DUF192 domain-containing protein [Streptomyces jeddahensis]|uniref:ACR n=1 Tax=Streptomyces jeddahensis TaxID=1716141 RepID=A0A177HST5_9ACTN|nr:DUF192 domain-containing protein [Streptomyces jeddahensis]OAH13786.1 hypothetical protein STSP_27640 [Streptomyces jeddahensis]
MGRWRDGRAKLVVHADGHGEGHGEEAEGSAVTVPLELATSFRARTRGLLGRDGIDGAILLSPANNIHTFRMRFAIDVACLDRHLNVLSVQTVKPGRLTLPRLRARHVLESDAGTMAGWGLRPGARVTVEESTRLS